MIFEVMQNNYIASVTLYALPGLVPTWEHQRSPRDVTIHTPLLMELCIAFYLLGLCATLWFFLVTLPVLKG
jgi:hypothetical protein